MAKNKAARDSHAGEAAALSVAAHPRASAHVRRVKGWGGLLGFAAAGYLAHGAGAPLDLVGLRALGGGVLGYLLAWAVIVTIWRHLLVAELRIHTEALGERGGIGAGGVAGPGEPGHGADRRG
jgi:hypothetical protein